jgi:hypothetical protein
VVVDKVIWARKIATWCTGWGAEGLLTWLFDWALYIFVIGKFGLGTGFLLMTLFTFLYCRLILWVYDTTKTDWWGFEEIKDRVHGALVAERNLFQRAGARVYGFLFNKGYFLTAAGIALLSRGDSVTTVVFVRKEKFSGLKAREWFVFLAVIILGNAFWAPMIYLGINVFHVAVEALYNHFR